jgi:hypothetical protein
MDVSISVTPSTVKLGNPVTITYSATGFNDVQISVPNYPNTFDLGGDDVSGTMKVLPLTDGAFTVSIFGYGDARLGSDSTCVMQQDATCSVT